MFLLESGLKKKIKLTFSNSGLRMDTNLTAHVTRGQARAWSDRSENTWHGPLCWPHCALESAYISLRSRRSSHEGKKNHVITWREMPRFLELDHLLPFRRVSGCGQAHAFQLTYTAPRISLTLEQRVPVCLCVGVPRLSELRGYSRIPGVSSWWTILFDDERGPSG